MHARGTAPAGASAPPVASIASVASSPMADGRPSRDGAATGLASRPSPLARPVRAAARALGAWGAIAPLVALVALAGCASKPPRDPELPPTPASVTRSNPGGDAADPERAALERLLKERWGTRRDRWNTLRVPLPDSKNWRRVRIWGHPTRVSYRYGDDHYAMTTVLYTKTEGPNDPDTCLAKFMDFAGPVAKAHDVKLSASKLVRTTRRERGEEQPMLVNLVEGSLQSLFVSDDYVGAIAVYQSWPETCLVQGFAVLATEHRDLAVRVRDRWVAEGAPNLLWNPKLVAAPDPSKAR